MDLLGVEGWQAGLVAGGAFVIVIEVIARAILHWQRHRKHNHCGRCKGCLDSSSTRSIFAVEHLLVCPDCGDTVPALAPGDHDGYFLVLSATTPELDMLAALRNEAQRDRWDNKEEEDLQNGKSGTDVDRRV